MNAKPTTNLRVLVVDDSLVYRKIVRDLLAAIPGVEVVGVAHHGRMALEKVAELKPDLLTLDLEMPELNGLDVLRALKKNGNPCGAIMLSALTSQGAAATIEALELGAFDFVLKPQGNDAGANAARLRVELKRKIDGFARTRVSASSVKDLRRPAPPRPAVPLMRPVHGPATRALVNAGRGGGAGIRAIAIGISTGGPKALGSMLPSLPASLPVPIFIVQHMPPIFTRSLAEDLNRRCRLRVSEAADGQIANGGEILIAPGGRQMKVENAGGQVRIRLTDDPPENSCRPSVDYLFRSVATTYGSAALGIIMTGMGNDGSQGCRDLKQHGATILAQDPASCVVFGMPREPIEQGLADIIAPLDQIAAEIERIAGTRNLVCR